MINTNEHQPSKYAGARKYLGVRIAARDSNGSIHDAVFIGRNAGQLRRFLSDYQHGVFANYYEEDVLRALYRILDRALENGVDEQQPYCSNQTGPSFRIAIGQDENTVRTCLLMSDPMPINVRLTTIGYQEMLDADSSKIIVHDGQMAAQWEKRSSTYRLPISSSDARHLAKIMSSSNKPEHEIIAALRNAADEIAPEEVAP